MPHTLWCRRSHQSDADADAPRSLCLLRAIFHLPVFVAPNLPAVRQEHMRRLYARVINLPKTFGYRAQPYSKRAQRRESVEGERATVNLSCGDSRRPTAEQEHRSIVLENSVCVCVYKWVVAVWFVERVRERERIVVSPQCPPEPARCWFSVLYVCGNVGWPS